MLKKTIQQITRCLDVYQEENKLNVRMRDLCFFQALFTMIKANQMLKENFVDLFEKILVLILERFVSIISSFHLQYFDFHLLRYHECADVSYSVSVSRTVNFWVTKLMWVSLLIKLNSIVFISSFSSFSKGTKQPRSKWPNDWALQ